MHAQTNTDTVFSQLKDGAILVRLQTRSKTISRIQDDNPALASKIKTQQAKENQIIVEAFSKQFAVCSVYFFYADNSIQIKEQDFELVLFDSNYQAIEDLPLLDNNYLIAEFSQAQGDSMQHQAKINTKNEQGEVVATRDTMLVYHTGYSIDALILMDADFMVLQKPYPHYVRKNIAVRARTHGEMVQKLNDKIEGYLTR
jgi:hypothetical protein